MEPNLLFYHPVNVALGLSISMDSVVLAMLMIVVSAKVENQINAKFVKKDLK